MDIPKPCQGDGEQAERFALLFSAHAVRLHVYIRTLVLDPTDSDEVFQNTSCILWRKFDTFDGATDFMAWACRIAYLEVCNFRRVKRRRPALSDQALELVAAGAEDVVGDCDWRRDALEKCLKKLDSSQDQLLRLRFHEQEPPKEIARRIGQSVHVVYRRLAKTYDDLMRCINAQAEV